MSSFSFSSLIECNRDFLFSIKPIKKQVGMKFAIKDKESCWWWLFDFKLSVRVCRLQECRILHRSNKYQTLCKEGENERKSNNSLQGGDCFQDTYILSCSSDHTSIKSRQATSKLNQLQNHCVMVILYSSHLAFDIK